MYKIILPTRYFVKRRITLLAVMAVALCVFMVVVVMTVMNGLVVEFKEKNHNFTGDCVVGTESLVGFPYHAEFADGLREQDFIQAASTVVNSFGLVTMPGADWNIGVEITGLDIAEHNRATGFGRTLYYHKDNPDNGFIIPDAPDQAGCVVGIDMMDMRSSQGQYHHNPEPPQIELIISCFPLNEKGGLQKAGTDLVSTMMFRYSDDCHSGLVKVDGRRIFVPIDYAQKLCGMAGSETRPSRASAIHIKFADGVEPNAGSEKVKKMWHAFVEEYKSKPYANLLDNVSVQSWINYNKGTIAPMENERTMLTLVFIMLGVITVFIIFVVFYMIVSHKSKDIGILRSIGASRVDVAIVFLIFAMFVGIVGAAVGSAAGCGFVAGINDMEDWLYARFGWQMWDRSIYAIDDIPNDIEWQVLAITIASAIAASLVGALLPGIQAARRKPVEILQVNQL